MRIVMVCEFFNEELEYQENLLVKYYRLAGHDVTVITSTFDNISDYYGDRHDRNAPARTYTHDGAKIIKLRYKYNILNRLRAYTSVYDVLEEECPDLIFVHDISPNFLEMIRYVKGHSECRMIMDYHADYSNSGANWVSLKILHGVLRKYFLDQARPYLQKIYPIVPAGFTFLEEVYGVRRSEMDLLPLGTDLRLGAHICASGARGDVRRLLGIPEDAFVIFTGGKLEPRKQTETLISAIRLMNRSDAHLVVVGSAGDSDYRGRLERAASGASNIHFVGWQNRDGVYRHLAASDVAVFPASQSVLWQQSIGMGLPLIVSERSGLTNWVPQEVGYLNRHDNIIILDHTRPLDTQIAGHLLRMMDDRQELRRRSEGARKTAAEILDWEILIQETLRFNHPAGERKSASQA